jgi:hypothetical protein
MSSPDYVYQDTVFPFRRGLRAGRDMRRLLRGVGRRRAARLPRTRRGCCCCPLVLMLGLAGLGLMGGGFYLGIRLLGWA